MSYSIKEKMKLLRELHNPEHAEADLRLLREVSPQNDLLRSPIVNAARAAEKILYSLLDQTTADKIRLNRRGMEVENIFEDIQEDDKTGEEKPTDTLTVQPNPTEQPEGNTPGNPGEDNPDGDTGKIDVAQQLQDTASELAETKEELGNIQSELEETQGELEETQEKLDETQEALEAEKKSELPNPPAPNESKKRTNTRRSTGKTSSTKTSK